MTKALDYLLEMRPPMVDTGDIWQQIILDLEERTDRSNDANIDDLGENILNLRKSIEEELVAFHESLIVSSYQGEVAPTMEGTKLWEIKIPVTLFPKRDHGFQRLECIVDFEADTPDPGVLRVLQIHPEKRDVVMARAELGAGLELSTNAKLGVDVRAGHLHTVQEAAGTIYGSVQTAKLSYEARRTCVDTEIVRGTGARWRLDDQTNSRRVGAEGHELRVVLEVSEAVEAVDAAGYLQAYSTVNLLTFAIDSSVLRNLGERIKEFFEKRGVPKEAYAEWNGILPT